MKRIFGRKQKEEKIEGGTRKSGRGRGRERERGGAEIKKKGGKML